MHRMYRRNRKEENNNFCNNSFGNSFEQKSCKFLFKIFSAHKKLNNIRGFEISKHFFLNISSELFAYILLNTRKTSDLYLLRIQNPIYELDM